MYGGIHERPVQSVTIDPCLPHPTNIYPSRQELARGPDAAIPPMAPRDDYQLLPDFTSLADVPWERTLACQRQLSAQAWRHSRAFVALDVQDLILLIFVLF